MNTVQSHSDTKILLVGAGKMAQDYYRVLKEFDIDITVFCRSSHSANEFKLQTGQEVSFGDLEEFLKTRDFQKVIVAVDIENLFPVSSILLKSNIKEILVEKPGGVVNSEIIELSELTKDLKANLYVAYNRRFYSSVIQAKEIIKQDGGVTSFSFEFTEWSTKIELLKYSNKIKENWFLCNSSHVADIAFHLCGYPKEIHSEISGKNKLSWHPSGSVFYGMGKTHQNILFNYKANWTGPGRWGLEVVTAKRKLILQPLEELQIVELNSIESSNFPLDNELDLKYKPGLFLQTKSFLDNNDNTLCSIKDLQDSLKYFKAISGYK